MEEKQEITEAEFEWLFDKFSFKFDRQQFLLDWGADKGAEILSTSKKSFQKRLRSSRLFDHLFLPPLMWHGVSSRWTQWLDWLTDYLRKLEKFGGDDLNPKHMFKLFALSLGRVESHRALSLTDEQYQTIVQNNAIWPSGRLKASEETVRNVITENGVGRVLYARLYIGLRLLPYDPSLSLHDDGETAVCIANGYREEDKRVHLMKLSIPKVEVSGCRIAEVQDPDRKKNWFGHRGIMFDANDERTERFTLYEVPFFKERLKSLRIFEGGDEIRKYLEPFRESQLQKMEAQQKHSTPENVS